VPAVISSVSDRDSAGLRELERLGLVPGATLVVEPGQRSGSVLIRMKSESDVVRLSHRLAGDISVVADAG
jgi:hypothetical protein